MRTVMVVLALLGGSDAVVADEVAAAVVVDTTQVESAEDRRGAKADCGERRRELQDGRAVNRKAL